LPVLEAVSVPVLWILGASDLHVPTAVTESIVNRLIEDGHANHTLRIYANADHDLHHAISGRLIDPRPDILEWLESIAALER
jgi:dienelactone hydrolase